MKLYKYCSFSRNLLSSLAKNTIWLSSPDKFNDVFDCGFKEDYLFEEDIRMMQAISSIKGNEHTFPYKEDASKIDRHEIKKKEYPKIKELIKVIGIYSMTENPYSLLMWAHYASNHTGVCLEFTIKETEHEVSPMVYSTQLPTLSIIEYYFRIYESLKSVLTTKSVEWAYEKEWRYISYGHSDIEVSCPFSLSSVIFGCRSSKDKQDTIKSILSNRSENINYYESFESDEEFRVSIRQQYSGEELPPRFASQ